MIEVRPIFHRGHNGRGILLIHGFTGTNLELRPAVEFFRGSGFAVSAPLLAGHGTTPQNLRKTSWREWLYSAEEGVHQLLANGSKVIYAAGLSMGGLLALKLAQKYEFRSIATLSTPIFVRDTRIKYAKWAKWFVPYVPGTREKKAPHIEKHIIPYSRTPLASVYSLQQLIEEVKAELPNIQTPIFIAQSGADETVDPASADYIYSQIGSHYKQIRHYPDSSHIITLDHDRHQLFMDMAKYFEEITWELEGR
jgi:carboxylesterase